MRNEHRPEPVDHGDRWRGLRRGLGEQLHTAHAAEESVENEKQPVAHPAGTILTTEQVADWLQVSTRQVIAMRPPDSSGLPRLERGIWQSVSAQVGNSSEASPAG